jgi:hypothetical protein
MASGEWPRTRRWIDGQLGLKQQLTSSLSQLFLPPRTSHPSNILVVDHATGRLQVFSPGGVHRCTRGLPRVKANDSKALALSPQGQLAILAHSEMHPEQGNEVMVWM